ncbi:MAG: hypothetical protein FWF76_07330 [Oscillospiraceae bacterium]|nr:hypothetical protein [Oscillospiraceae bacterium]
MKKLKFAVNGVLLFALLLTACTRLETSTTTQSRVAGQASGVRMQQSNYQMVDAFGNPVGSTNMEMLLNSDLVVVGEFVENSQHEFAKWALDDGSFVKGLPHSFNRLRVTEVLQGDIKIGEELIISTSYAVDENNFLISHGYCTPMHKGDRWLFFLTRFEGATEYFESINHQLGMSIATTEAIYSPRLDAGRFPVPDVNMLQIANTHLIEIENNKRVSIRTRTRPPTELETANLGVFNRNAFNFQLYAEVLEHFKIEPDDDWVNPGLRLDERLISLYENQTR